MFSQTKYILQRTLFTFNKPLSRVINQRYLISRNMQDTKQGLVKYREDPVVTNWTVKMRDLLLNQIPKDVDFATTATPDQMKDMFNAESVRMINTRGEKHGTITARINDKENFEVTTLRIDVLTDGRHAEVEFTTDWMLDANRRDLTINSMFLGLDGSLYDYFYGYEDLKRRKVSFVGDADTRIKEDYLRILRYFRFYGRIAEQPDNHDEITLRIINQNVSGMERISGERIWSELKKILEGNFAGELIKTMLHVGLAKYCGLPEKPNVKEFSQVWDRSRHHNLKPMTLLSALLNEPEDVYRLNDRLKLSAYDRELALFVVQHRELKPDIKPLLPYQRLIIFGKGKTPDVKEWTTEVLKYQNSALLPAFVEWTVPKFPVPGNMLRERYAVPGGRFMGTVIDKLKEYWVEHEFKPTQEDLLARVPEIKCKLEEKNQKT
ncbi:uncharacterized protein CBL_03822 [Carabus blaptoides fortunei]